MAKVRRFLYIVRRGSHCAHRLYKSRYGPVEGDVTACGISINKNWNWIFPVFSVRGFWRRCKRCENAK